MPEMIRPYPAPYEPGTITRSGNCRSFTAIHSKGGSTRGQSVVTFTGAPTYGMMLQYQVDLTKAVNGQVSTSTGLFTYNRSGSVASLADMLLKFAAHLNRFHDIAPTSVTGTTITILSDYFGFTPNLTIQTPSITAANVPTIATAPGLLQAGDLVVLTPTPLGFTTLPFRTANITAGTLFGVAMKAQGARDNDGRDQVYDILTEGYVSATCGGTTAKTPAITNINVFSDGTRPGMLSFGGLSHGATVSLSIGTANTAGVPLTPVNIGRQIRAITADVLPGQTFEVQLMGI
jgi:hypothetical protein